MLWARAPHSVVQASCAEDDFKRCSHTSGRDKSSCAALLWTGSVFISTRKKKATFPGERQISLGNQKVGCVGRTGYLLLLEKPANSSETLSRFG